MFFFLSLNRVSLCACCVHRGFEMLCRLKYTQGVVATRMVCDFRCESSQCLPFPPNFSQENDESRYIFLCRWMQTKAKRISVDMSPVGSTFSMQNPSTGKLFEQVQKEVHVVYRSHFCCVWLSLTLLVSGPSSPPFLQERVMTWRKAFCNESEDHLHIMEITLFESVCDVCTCNTSCGGPLIPS